MGRIHNLWLTLSSCVGNQVPFTGTITTDDLADLEELRREYDLNAEMSDSYTVTLAEQARNAKIMACAREAARR